jgi:hypothetical protein
MCSISHFGIFKINLILTVFYSYPLLDFNPWKYEAVNTDNYSCLFIYLILIIIINEIKNRKENHF